MGETKVGNNDLLKITTYFGVYSTCGIKSQITVAKQYKRNSKEF